ncbi:methionyl-tRNA formyltransferase [candidate division WOR-3 bacterium]|jgi:methionyl-tRNA formyltransferase|nr:methionyl-tRNA formyltransferase [candidate division WOR-3 bacterium]NOR16558.1 methionyl-tRNA formyltransferase [candidate division WOR-3 bacterium]
MRIIFFGSGQFTLSIVKKIEEEFTLLGVVITKPRPRGRGLKTSLPEMAQWAQSVGIEVFTPDNPNEKTFIEDLSELKPDLFVLSSYSHLLTNELFNVPKHGGINIHPSLLPKYRGAAPIQRAIMAGEKKTGITVIFMDEIIDHGGIIIQKELTIEPDDTYGSLLLKLSFLGTEIIFDVIKSIEAGDYKIMKQNEQQKTYAPKIKKEETIINWQESTEKIFNLIRALSPKPGVRTTFRNKELKIISAARGDKKVDPGVIHIEKRKLYIGTSDGSIILKEVRPENRSVITGLDFINGFRVKEGEVIG